MPMEEFLRSYAAGFLNGDPDNDRNIKLKLDHTLRVAAIADELSGAEALPGRVGWLLHVASMLHDIARFRQYATYHTFLDAESFDHGAVGAEIAEGLPLLAELSHEEREVVVGAVGFHNRRAIPPELSGDALTVLRAVRDADKLDIVGIVIAAYHEHLKNPAVTLGLSEERRFTPAVLEAVLAGGTPAYADLRTVFDFAAANLSWYGDLNFSWSCAEFVRRGYSDELLGVMDGVPGAEKVAEVFYQMRKGAKNAG